MIRLAVVLLLLGLAAAGPCDPCSVASGSYRVAAPPAWDRRSPLPLLLFLHGYRASGSDIISDPNVAGPAAELGFLLVAPDGVNGSWAHIGSPSHARNDLAFLPEVLRDARSRWPVDSGHVVAAGFSQGASMVWDLACYDAADFAAFLPVSGGFWEPVATSCHGGPVNLRHIHGRADTTVPLAGRHLFGPYVQGDIRRGFMVWLREDQCAAAPDYRTFELGLDCEIWDSCASGHNLQFCLHDGGHEMHSAWLAEGLRWALRQ